MAQLYLPAEHTEADLVLAGQIAESIESGELWVAWTPAQGRSAPEVPAELLEPEPGWPFLIRQAIRELWAALRGREPSRGAHAPRHPARQPAA